MFGRCQFRLILRLFRDKVIEAAVYVVMSNAATSSSVISAIFVSYK